MLNYSAMIVFVVHQYPNLNALSRVRACESQHVNELQYIYTTNTEQNIAETVSVV